LNRFVKLVGAVAVLGLVAAACGGGGSSGQPSGSQQARQGGTLRLGMNTDVCNGFDPQKAYCSINWEYTRVILRTLLSYNGQELENGGTTLAPDLATKMPTISSDGMTWTFQIQKGLHYAPPLQDVEITTPDIVRALEREADPEASSSGYSFYYTPIEGFSDFGSGKADSISGLSTPDNYTLQIKLTEPTGDLGYRFAMASTAPIPPNPDDAKAQLGIADGHTKDFGRFMVASGPYMFEGSEALDFSVPADQQDPVSGYAPERSITLVRNPSWDKSTDSLRPAYVDEIDVEIGATVEDISAKVDNGDLDDGFDASYTPEQLRKYATTPELKDQLHVTQSSSTSYVSLNVAEAPFDDLHVRKALNWVIDKEAVRRVVGGPLLGEIAGHYLADYNPFQSTNDQGDVTKAKEEMKQSKYDTDGDGVCDAPECKDVLTVADRAQPAPKRVAVIQDNLQQIGITLDVKYASFSAMYTQCEDPQNHVAMCPTVAWAQDYPDPITFMPLLFHSDNIFPGCCNLSMLGASSADLAKWGTHASEVPSADAELDKCGPLTGDERVTCYIAVEKDLVENIIPWVPLRFANQVDIVSTNLLNYTKDAFADQMSLDHVAVAGATGAAAS
jgi:peptide/nickel transport system substrate-binding protein